MLPWAEEPLIPLTRGILRLKILYSPGLKGESIYIAAYQQQQIFWQ